MTQFDLRGLLVRYTLKFLKIQNGGADTLKNPKITISRQRFDWSAQHLAWWRILAFRTRPAVLL